MMTAVSSRGARWRVVLDVGTSLVLIVAAGTLIWRTAQPQPVPRQPEMATLPTNPLALGDAASKGNDAAPVVLIEFSDFECPFCRQFTQEVLPAIQKQYINVGAVRLVFKHLPLTTIHPLAIEAARYSECAGQQGRFWQFHDAVFAMPRVNESSLAAAVETSGVATNALRQCLASEPGVRTRIDADVSMASSYSVKSTPTFFVGQQLQDGRVKVTASIVGAQTIDVFRASIDKAIKESSAKPSGTSVKIF